MPVTGVGGAASADLGTDAVVVVEVDADGMAVSVAVSVAVSAAAAAAEARTRLLGVVSVFVDDIFASAAFLFRVVGGILAVGMG